MICILRATALLMISTAVVVLAETGGCSGQVSAASDTDLATVAECSTFSGTLTVMGPGVTSIVLPKWTSLTGTLNVTSNRYLNAIELSGLRSMTGIISIFNNTILSSISVPNLASLNSLEVIAAPNLRHLALPKVESVNTLKIEDTGVDNSGPVPWTNITKAEVIGVSNNKFLRSIVMPQLTSVNKFLMVAANGLMEGHGEGSTLLVSNLTTCADCTFRHLTELDISSLTKVSSALAIDETNLTAVNAPKLKSVGQTMSIVACHRLTNASFPELTAIGGALQIANNTNLVNVDGFGKLAEIGGVLDVRGAIANMSFPLMRSIQGGLTVMSSSDFDCSSLANVKAGTRGKIQCQAKVQSARPINGNSPELDSNAGSASIHRGSALAALILLSGLALMF
ncbi:hypothetical protein BGW41_000105 [Actinomortierella wolfii]|nr:hypothetical protein BGW41_000105 [Actinomortierella wolfii]